MKTKNMRIKAVALSLAVITAFGAIAPSMQRTYTASAATVQNGDLEDYLKKLAPDKSTLLVDNGEGAKIDPESVVKRRGSDFLIIRRTKKTAKDNTADISSVSANMAKIYPGAIVHADSKLVDGRPDAIPFDNLKRMPVKVSVDINGNTQKGTIVEVPDKPNVMSAINEQIDNWLDTGKKVAADCTHKTVMAYDEKQISTELGVNDAAKTYGVDVQANVEGQKKEMLVCFNQIYYTANVTPQTASHLFDESVTPEDLAKNGINENNPAAAEVTSMDFGRQIVVKYSTDKLTADVEASWKASVGGNEITNNNKIKSVMENTTFSVYAYGGTAGAAAKLITTTKDIDKVNEIIASDMEFQKGSAALPVSYSTTFIDDGTNAYVSKANEYVETKVEKREPISVKTDCANWYVTKHQKFYGRPIVGVDEEGNLKLGAWKKLMDEGEGSKSFEIGGEYAEFGFSFDIYRGTDWPYSEVFYTADKGAASKINIEWGGACRTAWIEIKVDDKKVVDNTNCSSHSEYDFGC